MEEHADEHFWMDPVADNPPAQLSAPESLRARLMELDHADTSLPIPSEVIAALISNPIAIDLKAAIQAGSRAMLQDSQFELQVARHLTENEGCLPLEHTLRLLDILGAISTCSRIRMALVKLSSHGEPSVRSKVALIVGRHNPGPSWFREQLNDADARVRANVVESSWNVDFEDKTRFYWRAALDKNHRVVANALRGLYEAGDERSIAALMEMASNPSAEFRSAAAWAMGVSADVRFQETLLNLAKNETGIARISAMRALASIRKRSAQAASQLETAESTP